MNPGEKGALSNAKVSLTDTIFIDFNIKMFKKRAKNIFFITFIPNSDTPKPINNKLTIIEKFKDEQNHKI